MSRTLASALADTTPPPACKLCRYIEGATEDDRAALLQALDNSTVTHTRIAGAMTAVGYSISETSVRRHRRGCRRESEGSAQPT